MSIAHIHHFLPRYYDEQDGMLFTQKFRLLLQACSFFFWFFFFYSLFCFSLFLSLWQSFQGELIYDPVFLCVNDRQTQWEIIIWGKYCWIAVGGQGSQKVMLQPQTEKTSGESHTNLTASSLIFFFSTPPSRPWQRTIWLSCPQAKLSSASPCWWFYIISQ